MAKFADVLGRLEAYSLSVFLYVIGYIQMAASQNVETFAAAQIFYSAGGTGIQILQQVFIADTSDLLNRALWSSLPDVPFLITVWIGPIASQQLASVWRWGYGMWTIILPAAFLPLGLSLYLNQRKAVRLGLIPQSRYKGMSPLQATRTFFVEIDHWGAIKNFFFDIDLVGILLLSAAFALILIPLTIASKQADGWGSPSIIVMLVIGPLCLIAFPFWEMNKKVAPHPLVPLGMLKSRTFVCGCILGFFYFSKLPFSSPHRTCSEVKLAKEMCRTALTRAQWRSTSPSSRTSTRTSSSCRTSPSRRPGTSRRPSPSRRRSPRSWSPS